MARLEALFEGHEKHCGEREQRRQQDIADMKTMIRGQTETVGRLHERFEHLGNDVSTIANQVTAAKGETALRIEEAKGRAAGRVNKLHIMILTAAVVALFGILADFMAYGPPWARALRAQPAQVVR